MVKAFPFSIWGRFEWFSAESDEEGFNVKAGLPHYLICFRLTGMVSQKNVSLMKG